MRGAALLILLSMASLSTARDLPSSEAPKTAVSLGAAVAKQHMVATVGLSVLKHRQQPWAFPPLAFAGSQSASSGDGGATCPPCTCGGSSPRPNTSPKPTTSPKPSPKPATVGSEWPEQWGTECWTHRMQVFFQFEPTD